MHMSLEADGQSMRACFWQFECLILRIVHPAVRLFYFDSLFHQVPLYVSRVARAFIEAGFDPIYNHYRPYLST